MIRKAQTADLAAVAGLLRRSNLPLQGVDAPGLQAFVSEDGGRVVGAIALETYPPYGLFRSLAVDPRERGKGHGRALLDHVVAHAKGQGLTVLYGLTTTIADRLLRAGFEEIARDQIARAVHQSAELKAPPAARAFRLRLRDSPPNPANLGQTRPMPTTRS